MEDQPVFFFDQTEQNEEDTNDESLKDESKEKRSKKKKRKDLWAKLFETKDSNQIESGESSKLSKTLSLLFSRFAGVEKEEIVDSKTETGQKIIGLGIGMPEIEEIGFFQNNEVIGQSKENKTENHSQHTIDDNDYENENSRSINNDIENINDDIENKVSDVNLNNNSEDEILDTTENINSDEPQINQLSTSEVDFGIDNSIELDSSPAVEINSGHINNESINSKTEQRTVKEVGSPLLGSIVAEELSKSNNIKLKEQAVKIKKQIEKTRNLEEKTKSELAELKNKQARQQAELMYKRFRIEQNESVPATKDKSRELNTSIHNRGNESPKSIEPYIKNSLENPQTEKNRPGITKLEQKDSKKMQKTENETVQNIENTKALNNETVEQGNFEGKYISEQDRDRQQEKLKQSSAKVQSKKLEVDERESKFALKAIQQQTSFINQKVSENKKIEKSITRKTNSRPVEYHTAIKQGFLAGIIVLVSFLIVVFIWNLLN